MRTMSTTMVLVLAGSLAAGCKWTDFDDLADQTWVDSTEKPDLPSSDWGVALQRGSVTGTDTEGRLVIVGAGRPTLSRLVYDDHGDSKVPVPDDLTTAGITALDQQPLFLANPDNPNVALVVATSGLIIVAEGMQMGVTTINLSVPSATADAATYMRPPAGSENRVLVASGDVVVAADPANQASPARCKLTDGGAAIQPKALGAIRNGTSDDVVAWSANRKLYRYPGSVFSGCATMQEPSAPGVDTAFAAGPGSQILPLQGSRVLLQGHSGNQGFLQVFDAMTLTPVGPPNMTDNLRTAAILDVGNDQYAIAGCPGNLVEGKTAGEVKLFKIGATGIETAATLTLHDAQPENNQAFGRAVAAMPYRGKHVVAVAADNEVFVYFRLGAVYEESREE